MVSVLLMAVLVLITRPSGIDTLGINLPIPNIWSDCFSCNVSPHFHGKTGDQSALLHILHCMVKATYVLKILPELLAGSQHVTRVKLTRHRGVYETFSKRCAASPLSIMTSCLIIADVWGRGWVSIHRGRSQSPLPLNLSRNFWPHLALSQLCGLI